MNVFGGRLLLEEMERSRPTAMVWFSGGFNDITSRIQQVLGSRRQVQETGKQLEGAFGTTFFRAS